MLILEIVSLFAWLFTMPLLLLKSRCFNIGVDNSYQFGDEYLGLLANEILDRFTRQNKKDLLHS
jgi:hypothetical protein